MSIHQTFFLPLFTILMLIFSPGTIITTIAQNPFEIKSRIPENANKDSTVSIETPSVDTNQSKNTIKEKSTPHTEAENAEGSEDVLRSEERRVGKECRYGW